jgi:hypothetical protein
MDKFSQSQQLNGQVQPIAAGEWTGSANRSSCTNKFSQSQQVNEKIQPIPAGERTGSANRSR